MEKNYINYVYGVPYKMVQCVPKIMTPGNSVQKNIDSVQLLVLRSKYKYSYK